MDGRNCSSVLLVVTYSQRARRTLRNICNRHESIVVRRFGRAALFTPTEFGAFQALRLRSKHGRDVQLERTTPFIPKRDVPEAVRRAAATYENRDEPATPYARFANGREVPNPEDLRGSLLHVDEWASWAGGPNGAGRGTVEAIESRAIGVDGDTEDTQAATTMDQGASSATEPD